VLGECDPDVKENLLEAGDGELGFQLGRRRRDFVKSFEDRGSRGNNVVTGASLVPVAAVLKRN